MRVSKAQRLSNWEAEILTQQQQEYAATDAWVCIEIMKELQRVEPKSEKLSIISVMPTMQAPATEHHPKHHRRHRNKRREHHSEPQKQ
jgi:ribonuclease D